MRELMCLGARPRQDFERDFNGDAIFEKSLVAEVQDLLEQGNKTGEKIGVWERNEEHGITDWHGHIVVHSRR